MKFSVKLEILTLKLLFQFLQKQSTDRERSHMTSVAGGGGFEMLTRGGGGLSLADDSKNT